MSGQYTTLVVTLLGLGFLCPAAGQESVLDGYVAEGLAANLTLRQEQLTALEAEVRLTELRRGFLPSLSFDARYTRAQGGRSFEIPTGDLMNPVYGALNEILVGQGQPPSFPTIENQSIDFLRRREQETRVRLSQVVWNPALNASVRAQSFMADAAGEGVAAARAQLVRDIRIAYYTYVNATRAVGILQAAVDLVDENLRATESLLRASMTTPDRIHRARAERLEVTLQRDQAVADRELAAAHFNYLLNRDPAAAIQMDSAALELPTVDRPLSARSASLAFDPGALSSVDALVHAALSNRAELRQLDLALQAAEAGVSAARGQSLPSIAVALDAGIQGDDYRFDSGARFAMASVVFSWAVTNGGAERSRLRAARLQHTRTTTRRHQVERQIRLEVEDAARRAWVALAGLSSSRERVQEARDAFRFVNRRREEGLSTALEFLDARAALTRAELGLNVTETEALIRLAALEYASGLTVDPLTGHAPEEIER